MVVVLAVWMIQYITNLITTVILAVLKVEENCTNYHEVSTCTERVASKLWNSLVLTKQFKPVLDTQCL